MSDFLFRIAGERAETRADQLASAIAEHLGVRPVARAEEQPATGAPGGATRGDPVAVAALVLSVPSAVLATLDLAKRAKLAERLRALKAWARSRKESDPSSIPVYVVLPDGTEQLLDEADPGAWLDAASRTR